VRALVFVVLLALFWGNWAMMGGIAAIWALHEVVARVRQGK